MFPKTLVVAAIAAAALATAAPAHAQASAAAKSGTSSGPNAAGATSRTTDASTGSMNTKGSTELFQPGPNGMRPAASPTRGASMSDSGKPMKGKKGSAAAMAASDASK